MNDIAKLVASIDAEIEAEAGAIVDLCAQLVAAPSANPPGNTAEVARVVAGFLGDADIPIEVVAEDEAAPNIVGRVDGKASGQHVVFNAHMDTMQPGDISAWTKPVHELTCQDGRLYGLGMGNMKGALAAMCFATAAVNRHKAILPGRLTMTAVSDEVMFGNRGSVFLLSQRPDLAGDFLISGEGPGHMHLAPAEKGLVWIDIDVRGGAGHSSRALRGATPVMKLAALLVRIDDLNDRYADLPRELDGLSGGDDNFGLRLSLNAGIVEAPGVRSLIAPRARARIDIRLPPGITAQSVIDLIREAAGGDPDIAIKVVEAWDSNWTELQSPLVAAMREAAEAVRGVAPKHVVRLPGSDARRWRERGVPAACYGPQPTLSAGVDDYADRQDVIDCARVYARAAVRLMGSASAFS
jgi:succinyl-diaminopimelate desuccinylase